jgi:hypothetical protein
VVSSAIRSEHHSSQHQREGRRNLLLSFSAQDNRGTGQQVSETERVDRVMRGLSIRPTTIPPASCPPEPVAVILLKS